MTDVNIEKKNYLMLMIMTKSIHSGRFKIKMKQYLNVIKKIKIIILIYGPKMKE